MNFFVYIVYSKTIDKYYIGQTQDLENRILQHCRKKNLGANDWELKYSEPFLTRSEAVRRESEIKKKKRRSFIETLIITSKNI